MSNGLQFIRGMKRMAVIDGQVIPARDLSAEEVERYGGKKLLIASGLYKEYPKKKVSKSEE